MVKKLSNQYALHLSVRKWPQGDSEFVPKSLDISRTAAKYLKIHVEPCVWINMIIFGHKMGLILGLKHCVYSPFLNNFIHYISKEKDVNLENIYFYRTIIFPM